MPTTTPAGSSPRLKYVVVLATIVVVLTLIAFSLNWKNQPSNTPVVSPDILTITEPVHTVAGTVEGTNGTSFRLRFQPKRRGANIQTDLVYEVGVTGATHFEYLPERQILPFLASHPTQPETPSLQNLVTGSQVTVTTDADLRTLANSSFQAVTITLTPPQTKLVGQIQSAESGALTINIQAIAYGYAQGLNPTEGTRTLKLNAATQFYAAPAVSPRDQAVRLNTITQDLIKQGDLIYIETDKDFTLSDAVAVRVILLPQRVTPVSSPVPL